MPIKRFTDVNNHCDVNKLLSAWNKQFYHQNGLGHHTSSSLGSENICTWPIETGTSGSKKVAG